MTTIEQRICDADGTHHFSQVKHLALSAKQYLHACNHDVTPTSAMRLGTIVHFLTLGPRPGAKPLVVFDGTRRGKVWDAFGVEHADEEIVSKKEWTKASEIARAIQEDPIAQDRLAGARFEVPLTWEEDGGIICSTSGVDIVTAHGALGDLKTTASTYPDAWMRHAFRMLYPQQVAWYRRGARANGLATEGGLFLLGVETKPPYEVVDLELTEGMIDFADRTVALWLEKLRVYRATNQWPGYAQSPVAFDVPFQRDAEDDDEADDDGDDEDEEAAA